MRRLARWLGPWADDEQLPVGVERTERVIDSSSLRPLRVWTYRPTDRPPRGALLLIPGLHYAGPADPRLDRFARILAHSGIRVDAPFLPDFEALMLAPTLVDDAVRAFDALCASPDLPTKTPGVLSISFGSLPALRLAALRPETVGGVLVFGGYAEWDETMRFCLEGAESRSHDPLNRPVIFINLGPDLPGAPADVEPLKDAWRRYVSATWGRPEMKLDGAFQPVAHSIAESLPASQRMLFLQGCGAIPGGEAVAHAGLAQSGARGAYLDPRPSLSEVRAPVYLVHGTDDDVIPFEQTDRLFQAFPEQVQVRRYITGLYGHTGSADGWRSTLGEGRKMWGILKAIVAISGR